MIYFAPIFDSDIDSDGPTFRPQQPGVPEQAAPVQVAPPTPITPTPATTVVVAPADIAPIPTPRRAPTALPVPDVHGTSRFTVADYAGAARALLPRGRVWAAEAGSAQAALLNAIAEALVRIDAEAQGLLGGTKPGALSEMLPEWEASLGLPDPCIGPAPSVAQRLDSVRARFTGIGGQSRQHYIEFAAALGFAISITTYSPFRAGSSTVGSPVAGDDWRFAWGVTVIGKSGSLPVDVLICEMNAIKPAETTLVFLGDQGSTLILGDSGRPILSDKGSPILA